jgi:hypothetical protein
VVTLGRFSMCYGDVLKHAKLYGLDAGDALEYLDGCDEEKLSVAKDVTAVAGTGENFPAENACISASRRAA